MTESKSKPRKRRKGYRLRRFKYWLIYTFGCPLAAWLFRVYFASLRYRMNTHEHCAESAGFGPGIYVVFHSSLTYTMMNQLETVRRSNKTLGFMFSPSRDGEIAARIWRRLGARILRGSDASNRIGILRLMIHELREGRSVGFALDGPRGPRGKVKDGALLLARKTGRPLIPYSARAPRKWVLKTWDRQEIPKPFSKVEAYYIEPIYIPKDADDAALDTIKEKLRRELGMIDDDQ